MKAISNFAKDFMLTNENGEYAELFYKLDGEQFADESECETLLEYCLIGYSELSNSEDKDDSMEQLAYEYMEIIKSIENGEQQW